MASRLLIFLGFMALAGCTAVDSNSGTTVHLGATVSNTTIIR